MMMTLKIKIKKKKQKNLREIMRNQAHLQDKKRKKIKNNKNKKKTKFNLVNLKREFLTQILRLQILLTNQKVNKIQLKQEIVLKTQIKR